MKPRIKTKGYEDVKHSRNSTRGKTGYNRTERRKNKQENKA
jgi:hypothetical protein